MLIVIELFARIYILASLVSLSLIVGFIALFPKKEAHSLFLGYSYWIVFFAIMIMAMTLPTVLVLRALGLVDSVEHTYLDARDGMARRLYWWRKRNNNDQDN